MYSSGRMILLMPFLLGEKKTDEPLFTLTKLALLRAYEAMGLRSAVRANADLSAILDAGDTLERRELDEVVSSCGLKAALAGRDSCYCEQLG